MKSFLKKIKEEDLDRLERYQYSDNNKDQEYEGIRQIENLFIIINEYYYKLIKTKGSLNDNYIEYESKGDKDENLSLEDYLNIIRSYLRGMIDNHKAHGEWEIQLIMRINFISSLNTNEFRTMYTKSNNAEIIIGTETNNIINELFESFLKKYQEGSETKMERSSFVFESVDLLYYSLHKISLNRGRSYIDSPNWIKNEKATINPKNKDNERFKYAITASLNHEKNLKRPSKNIKN